jgi:transcriptional regulator with XRE-family HTH domain
MWQPMPAPKNIIGPTVRRLRNDAGLSQPMLAAKCGVLGWDLSREILAQIESQFRYVTDWELVVLARALSVTVETLIPSKFHKGRKVPAM